MSYCRTMVACFPKLFAVVVSLKHCATPALLYMCDKKVNTGVRSCVRKVKANMTYIMILRVGVD